VNILFISSDLAPLSNKGDLGSLYTASHSRSSFLFSSVSFGSFAYTDPKSCSNLLFISSYTLLASASFSFRFLFNSFVYSIGKPSKDFGSTFCCCARALVSSYSWFISCSRSCASVGPPLVER